MTKLPPVFDDKESAILLAIYEEANGYYDSYTLAWKLNPTVKLGTPEAESAFKGTRDATERLIERGFVRGERLKGADGVYFKELKLTPKGEQRNQAEPPRTGIRFRTQLIYCVGAKHNDDPGRTQRGNRSATRRGSSRPRHTFGKSGGASFAGSSGFSLCASRESDFGRVHAMLNSLSAGSRDCRICRPRASRARVSMRIAPKWQARHTWLTATSFFVG